VAVEFIKTDTFKASVAWSRVAARMLADVRSTFELFVAELVAFVEGCAKR
jgi:hypothetical protein